MKWIINLRASDEGFTFAEVLAALAVLSLSAMVLWSGLDRGLAALDRIHRKNVKSVLLSRFEYSFRREVNRLGPAYWEKAPDGDLSCLYMENDILILDGEAGEVLFEGLKLVGLERKMSGVEVHLADRDGAEHRIFALYGSFPLTGESYELP